jgi:RimJ/RimL family protein N-acetyltransferase
MASIKSIEIKELKSEHISSLVKKLSGDPPEYYKYFTAFELSTETLSGFVSNAVRDKYYGIFAGDVIAGFYMLRGFDAGYDIPSYGVWISSQFANKGLSKLTLYHAFAFCRMNKIKKLMLKVRPENIIAKNLYESQGFKQTGFDNSNGNLVYQKSISS